jgi:hypothetical protein
MGIATIGNRIRFEDTATALWSKSERAPDDTDDERLKAMDKTELHAAIDKLMQETLGTAVWAENQRQAEDRGDDARLRALRQLNRENAAELDEIERRRAVQRWAGRPIKAMTRNEKSQFVAECGYPAFAKRLSEEYGR